MKIYCDSHNIRNSPKNIQNWVSNFPFRISPFVYILLIFNVVNPFNERTKYKLSQSSRYYHYTTIIVTLTLEFRYRFVLIENVGPIYSFYFLDKDFVLQ